MTSSARPYLLAVRAAVSHREKCAVVLGAAVAVNIALTVRRAGYCSPRQPTYVEPSSRELLGTL